MNNKLKKMMQRKKMNKNNLKTKKPQKKICSMNKIVICKLIQSKKSFFLLKNLILNNQNQ